MTRAEIRTEIRKLLNDTNSDNYAIEDAEIDATLNAVTPSVAMETRSLLTYADYTVGDGTTVYTLPDDYMVMKQVEYWEDTTTRQQYRALQYVDTKQFRSIAYAAETQTGIPEYYTIEHGATEVLRTPQRPGSISIWPAADNDTKTLRIRYYQLPTAIATGSGSDAYIPEFQLYMHMAIVYRAGCDLAIKRGDLGLSRLLEKKYDKEIWKAKEVPHQLDRTRTPKDVMGYGSLD